MMQIRNYKKQYNGDASQFGKVGVLYGGTSAEREVSLNSGHAVLAGLLEAGVDAVGIDFQGDILALKETHKIDTAFIVLHGQGGEDGKIQAVLEALDIPFTGCDHASSALGMDKLRTKLVWMSSGIPTPDFVKLTDETDWQEAINKLGGRAFVKPVKEGSSIGMSVANDSEGLNESYRKAKQSQCEVIAERAIDGDEYTVAILNGVALPPIKVVAANTFYDYDAKYVSNQTQYLCPCGLESIKEQQVKATALEAFKAVGCSGWGRVDMLIDKMGNMKLLEVNTVPGMTSHSLVPMAAQAVGLSFSELVLEVLTQVNA